jgi:hypothetical protein
MAIGSLVFMGGISTAGADDEATTPPPAPRMPPASAHAESGEYVAPLSQQTQRSYVPQSVALSGPKEIKDWREGDPVPDGYRPVQRTRTGAIVGGCVTLGVMWLISALVAAAAQDASTATGGTSNPDAALYVPVVGPFIQMGGTGSALGNMVLLVDGLAQTAGFALLVYGVTTPRNVLVRADLAQGTQMVPMHIGRDGYGLGLRTTF